MRDAGGHLIYIVDDDDAVRDSLRLLLESNGIATRDYRSADDFLQAGAADMACLLLDLHIPGMSGLELLRLLRARGMTLPVIIISGRRDGALEADVRAAGATAILSKPFDDQALLELVQEALAAR
jgi:two-component system, LuxR family, response regulator FixJ